MKEENKKCWSCGRYQAYYTKGFCNLQKEAVGYCISQNKIVEENESCKMWRYRERVRNMRKKMAINAIIEISTKLKVIEEILKEEIKLEKIKDEKDVGVK